MPFAVTHILIPILLVALFRDLYFKKGKFSSHYVLIAGLGGVLPDIDIPISFLLNFFGVVNWNVHRLVTHSFILPLGLFALYFLFSFSNSKARICNLTKHKLKLSTIFLMLAIGTLIHLLLDFSFPYFIGVFSSEIRGLVAPTVDGVLLVLWIVYLELKHKISGFV